MTLSEVHGFHHCRSAGPKNHPSSTSVHERRSVDCPRFSGDHRPTIPAVVRWSCRAAVGQLDSQRLGQSDWAVRIRCAPGSAPVVATKLAEHPDTVRVLLSSGQPTSSPRFTPATREGPTPPLLSQIPVGRQVVAFEAYCVLHPPSVRHMSVAPTSLERPQPRGDRPAHFPSTGQSADRTLDGHAAGHRLAPRPGPRPRRPRHLPTAGGAHPPA